MFMGGTLLEHCIIHESSAKFLKNVKITKIHPNDWRQFLFLIYKLDYSNGQDFGAALLDLISNLDQIE